MAGRRRAQPSGQQGPLPVEDYRHAGATRPNNPPAAIAAEGRTLPATRTSYAYSPRLDPALWADPSGRVDALPPLVEKATREKLTAEEAALLAQEQQDGLPLPNLLRDDVRRWREADYRGATLATRKLLRHWSREDRERRLFFGQREAVETIIYLAEMRFTGRTSRLRFAPKVTEEDLGRLLTGVRPGPAFQLAQGAGRAP